MIRDLILRATKADEWKLIRERIRERNFDNLGALSMWRRSRHRLHRQRDGLRLERPFPRTTSAVLRRNRRRKALKEKIEN